MTCCDRIATEEWRPVIGFEGWYEVSNRGNIKRVHCDRRWREPRVLSLESNQRYKNVTLCKNGERTCRMVHRLVGLAFLPLIDGKNQINHIDGNRHNNDVGNLEWVTSAENNLHAYDIGLRKICEDGPNAKIRNKDIPVIRARLAAGSTIPALAREYGVSTSAIYLIKHKRTYSRVG